MKQWLKPTDFFWLWGGVVAQRLNGIHILNYLEESIHVFSEKEIAFF